MFILELTLDEKGTRGGIKGEKKGEREKIKEREREGKNKRIVVKCM